ncbi:acyl-CoA synthetase [Natronosalvus halobius]|uniref:acyl-CoA synthetase n=1 Tax=Natronosalvus halobius TaxID=2953746 RepID=UPI00209DA969|nr:benzoate-CoA ligase family protein [Natronosalvus halobius]USZ73643.1 benzoate-CoA ligase family protein [Natronosalvus halobius]
MQENIPNEKLPSVDSLPDLSNGLPELHYPKQINAAVEMTDVHVEAGRGNDVAIYFEGDEITYEVLKRRVNKLGNALLNLGIEPGERVFVRFPNRPEYVVSCLAAQKIGAVPVPSMKLLRANEISYVLSDAEPRLAIVDETLLEEVLEADEIEGGVLDEIVVSERTDGDHGYHRYEEIIADESDSLSTAETSRDDAVMLAYTSGTTGQPKGTLHTHRQMLAIADGYANYCLDPRQDDVFCSNAPIAFTFGYGMEVAFPLRFGASTVLIEDAEPEDLVRAVDEYGVTVLGSIPTAYNQLFSQAEKITSEYDLSSLRIGVSAGEPLPPSTYEQAKELFEIDLLDGIGTTEMLHIFISHQHDDEISPTATGFPVPGYECRVADPETGEELDRGEPGLLEVRGPTGITYWDRPEKQNETVRDGWSVPGDIFIHREDGRFEYKSRRDDLIITSGYNVPGPEVENVLEDHETVYESAVVGSPDEERGQIVRAFVVLSEGVEASDELTDTLQDFVKDRIAPYKYPRQIEYVSELPKTETGKIRRAKLRERGRQ